MARANSVSAPTMAEIENMDLHELGEVIRERAPLRMRELIVESYSNSLTPLQAAIFELMLIDNDATLRYQAAAISA